MPLPLVAASIGLSVAGGIIGAQAAQKAARAQAKAIWEQAAYDLQLVREDASAAIGTQMAGYASMGVDANSGSPLLVMAETKERALRDQQHIMKMAANNANAARAAGQAGAMASTLNAGAGVITAMGKE